MLTISMYRSLVKHKAYNPKITFNKDEQKIMRIAIRLHKIISKRKEVDIPGIGIVSGSLMYAYLINKMQVEGELRKVATTIISRKTSEYKEKFIEKDIKQNRVERKIFYLCSSHDDCAKDHENYQGKIYIDENWRDYTKDVKAVSDYVKSNNIKKYQWVMNSPVWLLTRPNCRHYMQALGENEVLGSNAEKLIDKYGMHRKVGTRDNVQTLRSKGKDIETMINAYKERLDTLNKMYKIAPNRYLQAQISKNTMLLRKWINAQK